MIRLLTKKWRLIFLFIAINAVCGKAEDRDSRLSLNYAVETRATFSGGENTPFWLVSNQFGLGSPEFNNGYVRAKINKELDTEKKFSWGINADLVGQWNLPAPFRVQQLFADIKYRALWVSIGSREYLPLYNNIRLSSGDLLFSGNSLPIPQLRIGTYGFAPFWGTKGWLSVKAYLSYGMFTDSRWQKDWVIPGGNRVSDALFCGKGLWFRIGNLNKFPLTVDLGVELGTQFGGTAYNYGKVIKMPTKLIDWLKAIIPLAGSSDTPEEEQTNVQGNMTGEYSVSISYSPAPGWNIRPYWEHFFEDHSQMFLEYGLWKDGLWGLEITFPNNPFFSKIVYEFIATKDQTGPVNHDYTPEVPEQVSGGDNYYNHHLYGSWQTWGMTIGTPLAISPLYNRIHNLFVYNSRFLAHHIGFEGSPYKNIDWRLLMTFSQNWGTYRFPLKEIYNNWSGLVEVKYSPSFCKGFHLTGALAWDKGKLLGNNFGGLISLGFDGNFNLKK